jgi:hypothetical protein
LFSASNPNTETDEEDVDEMPVIDRIAKFVKLVGDGMKMLIVDAERGVPLNSVAELGVEAVDVGIDVVLKQLTERSLKGGSSGGLAEDKIKILVVTRV